MKKHKYTHVDKEGVRWRMNGSRPVSEIADLVADLVMDELGLNKEQKNGKSKKESKKTKGKVR